MNYITLDLEWNQAYMQERYFFILTRQTSPNSFIKHCTVL